MIASNSAWVGTGTDGSRVKAPGNCARSNRIMSSIVDGVAHSRATGATGAKTGAGAADSGNCGDNSGSAGAAAAVDWLWMSAARSFLLWLAPKSHDDSATVGQLSSAAIHDGMGTPASCPGAITSSAGNVPKMAISASKSCTLADKRAISTLDLSHSSINSGTMGAIHAGGSGNDDGAWASGKTAVTSCAVMVGSSPRTGSAATGKCRAVHLAVAASSAAAAAFVASSSWTLAPNASTAAKAPSR
ncbi:hypothetical protein BCR44DRAFT_1433218 [Catenaria anguillulae PL171]|uniref:Uncharacterized protein n=1 Tax=Catenaria anguillulae PL171 TaxID=765915 RepID=A0A1Y2HMY1_9FUNG|nr:hypothetical protein BCR44DRAFT_1433218 [Catenaria anguillulae PL171]